MAAEGPAVASRTELEAMLLRCPFHRWLGLRLVGADTDQVEVEMPWREELVSNPDRNIVHGGILASVIDAVGDLAIGARLGYTLPTIDLHIDYHKAATQGPVRIVGRVVSLGRAI